MPTFSLYRTQIDYYNKTTVSCNSLFKRVYNLLMRLLSSILSDILKSFIVL